MSEVVLGIRIAVNNNGAARILGQTRDNLNGVDDAARRVDSTFSRLASYAVGFLGIRTAFNFASDIISVNREMESLRAQLKSLTGTAEGGAKAFKFIQDFAINTPFQIQGLTKAFISLQNFGIKPTAEVMKAITNQASKLGGSQEVLSGITLALGQAYAKGKLQAEEMMQLIERGVPVYKILSEATGKSTAELMKMSQQGLLTRDTIDLLISKMGELASGSNAEQMATLNGSISNLGDAWVQFEDVLLNDKSEGIMKSIVNGWTNIINEFKNYIAGGTYLEELNKKIAETKLQIKSLKGGGIGTALFSGTTQAAEENKLRILLKKRQIELVSIHRQNLINKDDAQKEILAKKEAARVAVQASRAEELSAKRVKKKEEDLTRTLKRQDLAWKQLIDDANKLDALKDGVKFTGYLANLAEELSAQGKTNEEIRKRISLEREIMTLRENNPNLSQGQATDIATQQQVNTDRIDAVTGATNAATESANVYAAKLLQIDNNLTNIRTSGQDAFGGMTDGASKLIGVFSKLGKSLSGYTKDIALNEKAHKAFVKDKSHTSKQLADEDKKYKDRSLKLNKQVVSDTIQGASAMFGAISSIYQQQADASDEGSRKQAQYHIKALEMQRTQAVFSAIAGIMNQLSGGDPYTAIPRALIVAAFAAQQLSQIDAQINSSSSAMPSSRQETQGRGTVLGDKSAVSKTVDNSIKLLAKNAVIGNDYSSRMLDVLKDIKLNTEKVGIKIATSQDYQKLITATQATLGNKNVDLFTSIGTALVDSGVIFDKKQTIGSAIDTGKVTGDFFTITQKTYNLLFGSIKSGFKNNITDLGSELETSFGSLFSKTYDSIFISVDKVYGKNQNKIDKLKEQIRGLDLKSLGFDYISLKNLSGSEITKVLSSIVSAGLDKMAEIAFPQFKAFQRFGEGLAETVARVLSDAEAAKNKLISLGIEAIKYSDILYGQRDVQQQIIKQSILKSDIDKNIIDVMQGVNGDASKLISTYKKLIETQHQLIIAGQGLNTNLSDLTKGFGGDASGALKTYNEYFISSTKLATAEINYLSAAFNKAGYQLPQTKQQFIDLFNTLDDTGKGRLLAAQDQWTAAYDLYTSNATDAADKLKTIADIINKINLDSARIGASTLQKDLYSIQDGAVQTIATVLANGGKLSDVMIVFNNAINNGNIAIQKARDTIHSTFNALYKSINDAMVVISDSIVKILTPDNLANVQKNRAYSVLNDQSANVKDRIKAAQTLNKLILKGYSDQKAAIDKIANASKQLLTYVDSLLVNSQLSTLSNQGRLNEAKAQFNKQLALAQSGDSKAAQGLSGFSNTYLTEAKGFFASGKGYADIFNKVTGSLTDFANTNKDPATITAQATQKTVTELQAINATLSAIKSQQGGLESGQIAKLNSDAVTIAKQFTDAVASLDKMSQTVKRDLQVTLKGNLSKNELTLLTKLYSKNPNSTFTATLNATLSGALSQKSGLTAFDNFFKVNPNNTFSATLSAVNKGTLSNQQGIQLFNRMFANSSTKTFSAALNAVNKGVLTTKDGINLFNRMFTGNTTSTLTAILAAYHGGELTKASGLVLFDRMFQANPNNTYSAVLSAVKAGILSQSGGETLFNRMFQADPNLTATKTINVKKGVWNATAANIAEAGLTNSTSKVTVSSTLTLDSVLNNSILSYSKVDVANVYNRIATATEKSGNFLALIYSRLWNIEVYENATATYMRGLFNAAASGGGFTVHSEFRGGTLATFAKGGVTNEASIFGEAGWEAAVPLPDGRTIPVTIQSQPSSGDNETKRLLEQVLSELKAANNQRGQIAMTTIKQSNKVVQQTEAQVRAIKRQAVIA